MAWVYRYIDLADDTIKYVGVVWGKTRTLEDRIKEHSKEKWCKVRKWRIEYIVDEIETQAEAEAYETHYINLWNTGKYFNVRQVGRGTNKFLQERNDWTEYKDELEKSLEEEKDIQIKIKEINDSIKKYKLEFETIKEKETYIKRSLKINVITKVIEDISENIDEFPFSYDDVIFCYTHIEACKKIAFESIIKDKYNRIVDNLKLEYYKSHEKECILYYDAAYRDDGFEIMTIFGYGDDEPVEKALRKARAEVGYYYPNDTNIYNDIYWFLIQFISELEELLSPKLYCDYTKNDFRYLSDDGSTIILESEDRFWEILINIEKMKIIEITHRMDPFEDLSDWDKNEYEKKYKRKDIDNKRYKRMLKQKFFARCSYKRKIEYELAIDLLNKYKKYSKIIKKKTL